MPMLSRMFFTLPEPWSEDLAVKWLNFLDCAQMERLLQQEMDEAPETMTY
jgi:hypothetical protein